MWWEMEKKFLACLLISLFVVVAAVSLNIVTERVYASFPVTVTDDIGRTVTIERSSQRIVCITPSTTEIAYALGLGDRIVGVDVYSDYPPEAVLKQKISNIYTPNPEEVASLNPDLVLMYSFFGKGDPYVDAIANLGINVIALKPTNLSSIINDILLVGKAAGKIEEAETLALQLNETVSYIVAKVQSVTAKPNVYVEYWYPPPWTFGPNTWGDEIIRLAGGVNAFGDAPTDYVETTDEEVIAKNPDIIISLYGAQHLHFATLEEMKQRNGWTSINAVQNGKVYLLDENLIVRPGPRIVLGLEAVAKFLHPELFGTSNLLALNTTILKTSTQTLNVTGIVKADVAVFKATGNGTLIATVTSTGPAVFDGLKLVGSYLELECSTPEGLVLVLRIYYSESELASLGVDEGSLKVYYWSSEEEKWLPLISSVNMDANYVEAFVPHLTCFALIGESPPPLWNTHVPLWLVVTAIAVISAITCIITYAASRKR